MTVTSGGTVTLTFATATAGTYQHTDSEGTQDGTFVLFATPVLDARSPIANDSVQLTITAGGGNYPTSGSARTMMSAST